MKGALNDNDTPANFTDDKLNGTPLNCTLRPMKIRFWPGICWSTCAVHSDACGCVRIGAR